MRKYILILFLSFVCNGNTQIIIYEYCFDQAENCTNYIMSDPEPILSIDISTNPNNVWQIGPPQKSILNNPFSSQNVIITDTINTYSINDTSSFTIESTAIQSSSSVNWSNFQLSFNYFVDSDTLVDFGMIEFSPDNGANWIDLIGDPSYSSFLEWVNNITVGVPTLSGATNGWIQASVDMRDLGVLLDIQPGTTFKWRFSFISDANQNNRDGLMYDNIFVTIAPPIGLKENYLGENKKLVKVVDLMGKVTEIASNTTLIYIYDDGTTEKVFRVE